MESSCCLHRSLWTGLITKQNPVEMIGWHTGEACIYFFSNLIFIGKMFATRCNYSFKKQTNSLLNHPPVLVVLIYAYVFPFRGDLQQLPDTTSVVPTRLLIWQIGSKSEAVVGNKTKTSSGKIKNPTTLELRVTAQLGDRVHHYEHHISHHTETFAWLLL